MSIWKLSSDISLSLCLLLPRSGSPALEPGEVSRVWPVIGASRLWPRHLQGNYSAALIKTQLYRVWFNVWLVRGALDRQDAKSICTRPDT